MFHCLFDTAILEGTAISCILHTHKKLSYLAKNQKLHLKTAIPIKIKQIEEFFQNLFKFTISLEFQAPTRT